MIKKYCYIFFLLIVFNASNAQNEVVVGEINETKTENIEEQELYSDSGDEENNSDTTLLDSSITDSIPPIEKMPVLDSFVVAEYVDSLVARGVEGRVVLELLVSDSGSVDSAVVKEGLHPVLDEAALKAVSKFHFTPAVAGGNSVPVFLTYEYLFTLEGIVKKIEEYINITGIVIEKGTRKKIIDALIVLSFPEISDTSIKDEDEVEVIFEPLNIPFKRYLEKIGSFDGQYLEEGHLVTTTDSLGVFKFKSVSPGKVGIKIIATGCELYEDNFIVNSDEKIEVKYRIERSDYSEYEIVVYGKQEEKEVSRRVMKTYEAKRVPGCGGDAIKAVQALPGVARPVFGGTEIVIRGADWGDNKYLLDGIPIPHLWHDLGQTSVVNSNLINKIVLYPGGYGVRYGDVLGGIIEIDMRSAKKDKWHGIVDMNLIHSSLILEIPFNERLSFIGSIRREYLMSVAKFVAETFFDEHLDFTAFYWDFSLRMDYKPTKSHTIFAEYSSAKDTAYETNIRGSGKEDGSYFGFGRKLKVGIVGWDWDIAENLHNSFRYGFTPHNIEFDNMSIDFNFKYSALGIAHTIRDDLIYSFNDKLTATLGLDVHMEPVEINRKFSGSYWDDYEYIDTSFSEKLDYFLGPVGAYISCEIKPMENLSIVPSYRLDYYPELKYHGSIIPEFWDYNFDNNMRWSYEPSFRISTRYNISEKHTVKGALGNYNKSPKYNANEKWGNPNLEPARGTHYTLGYELKLTDLISLDIQGYLNRQWNKAQYVWGEELQVGESEGFVNRGKARMRGLEFFLRHDQGRKFFGWLSYTLSYSERYDYTEKKWIVFDRNILNNIQLVASWNLKRNKVLGFRIQYTEGYPYTPRDVLYYDAANFIYVGKPGEKNSAKHKPYIGIDFRFEKKIAFNHSLFTFYVGCDRLLHFLQFIIKDDGTPLYYPTEYPSYNYDYSKFEGFANFPAPTFGLSLEF